jgi:hypothetical protein
VAIEASVLHLIRAQNRHFSWKMSTMYLSPQICKWWMVKSPAAISKKILTTLLCFRLTYLYRQFLILLRYKTEGKERVQSTQQDSKTTPKTNTPQILHNKYMLMLILRVFTTWTSSPLTVLGANTIFTSKMYIISILRRGLKAVRLVF